MYYVTYNHAGQIKPLAGRSMARLARPRRRRRMRGLGDLVNPSFGLTSNVTPGLTDTQLDASSGSDSGASVVSYDPLENPCWFENAFMGTLCQGQETALSQQESSQLIQAGMPAPQAQQTAQSDVGTVLAMNNASPSTPWYDAIFSNKTYIALALGGGALLLFMLVRRR